MKFSVPCNQFIPLCQAVDPVRIPRRQNAVLSSTPRRAGLGRRTWRRDKLHYRRHHLRWLPGLLAAAQCSDHSETSMSVPVEADPSRSNLARITLLDISLTFSSGPTTILS